MSIQDDEITTNGGTCFITNYNVPADRSGCDHAGNGLHESFNMNADFSGPPCVCCEYRQYIKGYFRWRLNSSPEWNYLEHRLYEGRLLHPNEYREDGIGSGAYGHRAFNGCSDAFLPPPRATGCQYRGQDRPGFQGLQAGIEYEFYLEFRGEIINVCAKNTVLESSEWVVACQCVA